MPKLLFVPVLPIPRTDTEPLPPDETRLFSLIHTPQLIEE